MVLGFAGRGGGSHGAREAWRRVRSVDVLVSMSGSISISHFRD
jgi:hypothetical protein